MPAWLSSSPLDPWEQIRQHQQDLALRGKYGATSIFVGTMRDFNAGDDVTEMFLEHYPGMTDRFLHIDMLSGLTGIGRHQTVPVIRGCDDQHVDILTIQNPTYINIALHFIAISGSGFPDTIIKDFSIRIAQGDYLDTFTFLEIINMLITSPPYTGDSYPYLISWIVCSKTAIG